MDNEPTNLTLVLLREIRANQEGMQSQMEGMNAELNARIDALPTKEQVAGALRALSDRTDKRFDAVDKRFDAVDQRLDALRSEITIHNSSVRSLDIVAEGHEKRISRLENDRGSELDRPITEPH